MTRDEILKRFIFICEMQKKGKVYFQSPTCTTTSGIDNERKRHILGVIRAIRELKEEHIPDFPDIDPEQSLPSELTRIADFSRVYRYNSATDQERAIMNWINGQIV